MSLGQGRKRTGEIRTPESGRPGPCPDRAFRALGMVEFDHERTARGRETEQDQPAPLDRAFRMFEPDRGRVAVGAEFRLDILFRGAAAHLEILLELLGRARRSERPLEREAVLGWHDGRAAVVAEARDARLDL